MTARFAPGSLVRVSSRESSGHMRTPRYIRGKSGVIERMCGEFKNPELLAYGTDGKDLPLYRVRFLQRDVWPGYEGSGNDTIDVEIYEHWLEGETR